MYEGLIQKEKPVVQEEAKPKKPKKVSLPRPERFPEVPNEWNLSTREFAVMRLLATGVPPKVVAERLCLSVKTVCTYSIRAWKKMKAMNQTHGIILFVLKYHNLEIVDPMRALYEKAQKCAEHVESVVRLDSDEDERTFAFSVKQLLAWKDKFENTK